MLNLAALALFLCFYSFFFVLSTFSYSVTPDHVLIRWRLPGGIPYRPRRIAMRDIAAVKRYAGPRDFLRTMDIRGNLPSKRGVVISLRRGFPKAVWVTPDGPTPFIDEVSTIAFAHDLAAQDLPL